MTRGELVARGNTANVIAWGPGTVAKVLHPTTRAAWAHIEAATLRLVRDAGLPAPSVLDVIVVGGRPALVLERVDGPSLWDVVLREPVRVDEVGRELADLQHEISAVPAPIGMLDLRSRLTEKIASASALSSADRAEALRRLDVLPGGDRVCHGDLHPGNVLCGPDGRVVVDWFDAAAGEPWADVVRTSLLVRPPIGRRVAVPHLPGASRLLLRRLHGAYRERVTELRGCGRAAAAWEPVMAAGRLSEQVPRDELLRVWRRRTSVAPVEGAGPPDRPPAVHRIG